MCNVVILFFNWERWLSGLKRRIANPLYELFVPRVRIPLFPFPLMTLFICIIFYLISFFFQILKILVKRVNRENPKKIELEN